MQCPNCQHTDSRVLESRSSENGQSIRRRRECLQCKYRFTTYEKTGIPPSRLEAIVNDIESRLQQDSKREVTSQEIGQLVLEYLRQESEVAYVRFASVYGNFQGIRDFIAALALLQSSEIERAHPSWSQVEEASVITSS
jgi:transcriptional repressor NrdR